MSDIETDAFVVEEYFKRQAKDLTNLLFDKDFLNPDLTRETIDWLEDYIGFVIQSHSQTAAKWKVNLISRRK